VSLPAGGSRSGGHRENAAAAAIAPPIQILRLPKEPLFRFMFSLLK
jgi:hypothetical protein